MTSAPAIGGGGDGEVMLLVLVVGLILVVACLVWLLWGFWRALDRLHRMFMVLDGEVRDLRTEVGRSR